MTAFQTHRPRLSGACLLLLVVLLQGCAGTPQTDRLLSAPPASLPQARELNKVPFYAQDAYQCGPASLAMLFNWQGVDTTPQQLTPQVYIPAKQGSLQLELISNTRQHNLVPYVLKPSLEDLLTEIAAGNPVLVLQNLALDWYPQWHYAVAVGYDLPNNQLILRSGTDRRRITNLPLFERTWQRADHWALLALKPGQLPATVEYWRYLQAAAGMEKVHKFTAALAAYQAGLEKWQNDQRLLMGVSNSYYALGKLEQAASTLNTLIRQHPEFAPAYNNLAQIYLDRGQLAEAEEHAQQAVKLGGKYQQTYEQTLQEIRKRRE